MRALALVGLLAALSACGEQKKPATYTCPNGPSIAASYVDDTVTLYFPTGRSETLTQVDADNENLFAKPGMAWRTSFRDARLDDNGASYHCDQMAG